MELNLDYFNENNNVKLTEYEEEIISKYFEPYNKGKIKSCFDLNEVPFSQIEYFSNVRYNIINWVDLKSNASFLELNPDFGEITQNLLYKSNDITAISNSIEKAKALEKRFRKEENLLVYVADLDNVKIKRKFDYIVIIGTNSLDELKKQIKFAKNHLVKGGRIFLAFDNKFGIKYFSGIKERANYKFDEVIGSEERLGLNAVSKLLDSEDLHFKVYYPLPDYRITNVVYSDEKLPNDESILSRVLEYYDEKDESYFSQRKAYIELIKENKDYFKYFSNSYFFEISNEVFKDEIRYANFEVYRNEKYNIKTIMKEKEVLKKANSKISKAHIETIKKNIELLNKLGIKTLDSYEENTIISKFEKSDSLDSIIVNLCKEGKKKEALELFDRFINEVVKKLEIIEKPKKTVFDKFSIDTEFKDEFHYVKDGLIDLITNNTFIINKEFYVYDQEWVQSNCPIEFIIYRNIFFNSDLSNYISKEELYKKYSIDKYVDLFGLLDSKFQDSIRNMFIWKLHVNSMLKIEDAKNISIRNTNFLKENLDIKRIKYDQLKEEFKKTKKEAEACDRELINYRNKANDFENRLRVIESSFSWKITKPIRYIGWRRHQFINYIKNKISKKRNVNYKLTKKYLESYLSEFKEKFDIDTVNYFKELIKTSSNEMFNLDMSNSYHAWILNNEPTGEELINQKNKKFKYSPKISLLVPLYKTKMSDFRDMLFFLEEQTYSNWELCLADGSPKELKEIQEIIKNEPRIKYTVLEKNGGISENTNECLKLATGDYIALLDHDDYLSIDCLYEVVKCINEHDDLEFVYTDEDKTIGPKFRRFDPYFKNDFAPDTLNSQNYICHFSVFKKSVMDKLKGLDKKFDGAQDYDIFLRMSEIVEAKNIYHIPKICYHWRVSESSTAGGEEAKPWAFEAGKNAIEAHLKRLEQEAVVKSGIASGTYEVEYKVIGNPKVNLIIPNKDSIDILKVLVNSIIKVTTYDNYEIDIIENNSTTQEIFDYYKYLERNYKNIRIIKYPEKGFNYSKIINFGVKNTKGDFVMQLNNDTEIITPDWLEKMIGYCQQKHIGAVGAKLLYPDYTVQHAGVLLGLGGIAGHFYKFIDEDDIGYFAKPVTIQDMSAVTAACIMTKREIYEKVGYMNEALAVAFNDIDFCMKIRKQDLLIVYNPYVKILHFESKSRGEENSPEKVARFNKEVEIFKKYWQKELDKGDPYYNKNLRLDNDRYEIRTEKVDKNNK